MRAARLNRILLVLAFVGIFIAGTLSISHLLNIVVPCGTGEGCQQVTTHRTAYWFKIPVAYFGLAAYVTLAILAWARSRGGPRVLPLANASYAITALGTILSLYLQYIAFYEIRPDNPCWWCLSNATVMVASLIGTAFLVKTLADEELVPSGKVDFFLPVGLAAAAALGLLGMGAQIQQSGKYMVAVTVETKGVSLVPENAHMVGNENAPITVIEFADMGCPACKLVGPQVKAVVEKSGGRMRLVYRHFPIDQLHPASLPAAIIGEYAAEKNRFWEYLDMTTRIEDEKPTIESYWAIAKAMGFDQAEIEKRMSDTNDPIFLRVFEDVNTARELGLRGTPTFIVQAPGQPDRMMMAGEVLGSLSRPPYSTIGANGQTAPAK